MDISPNLAALAAVANPAAGVAPAAPPPATSDSLSQQVQQLLAAQDLSGMGAGSPAAANPAVPGLPGSLNPGNPRRNASSLNVPLPMPVPGGQPPPTPNAQVPGGPPPTPNAQVPQGPPPTPNAPQGPPPPPPAPPLLSQMINPARVIQGPVTHANMAAALGRGGDNQLVHATGGEQMVPPDLLAAHPELHRAIQLAFAAHGRDSRAHQVGNPQQSVNPDTGLGEGFGFDLQTLLPMALAAIGTFALPGIGTELGLEAGGLGSAALGAAGGAIGGGIGNEIVNPDAGFLNNFGRAAIGSAAGAGLGALIPSGAAAAGAGANATAGAGANATAGATVANPLPEANYATGAPVAGGADFGPGVANAGVPTTATGGFDYGPGAGVAADAAASGAPGFMDQLSAHPLDTLWHTLAPKGVAGIGAGLAGGLIGDMAGNALFPAKNASKIASAAGGGQQNPVPLTSDALEQIRRRAQLTLGTMPDNPYLQTYGASPATPPVRFLNFS